MRIHLPLEVWVDVFAPISRPELAHRLTEIGSRSFADIAMFFLHEYGQIKLSCLSFGGYYDFWKMAEAEMPTNIKDFELIEICAQDDQIDRTLLNIFFTNLQPILSNVNLWCNHNSEGFDWYQKENQVPDFLNQLFPLIESFNSIHFYDDQCFDLVHEKIADKSFAAKVVSIDYRIMKKQQQKVLKKALITIDNDDDGKQSNEQDNVDAEQNNEENEDNDEEGDDDNKNAKNEEDDENKEEDDDDNCEYKEDNDDVDEESNDDEYEEETVLERRMAILRKWLLFDYNNVENNEANEVVDHARILYVENISFEMCRIEIDDIFQEFMQSTKPTQFIVCFTIEYWYANSVLADERRNIEAIRHVNQTTNELLSAKCFEIGKNYDDKIKCVVFLHSHPIVSDGEEHEGNMLLINKIRENMPERYWNKMKKKFVYSTYRHINIYREGRAFDDDSLCGMIFETESSAIDEDENNEKKKNKEEEETLTSMSLFRPKKKKMKRKMKLRPKRKNKKNAVIGSGKMNFLCQKELRIEAFERRMKSRIKEKKKLNIKKTMAQMTINGGIGEWWKKDNKKQKNMAEIFD